MKTKLKQLSKSTLSVVLALMMIISTMLVGIISVNAWDGNIYIYSNIFSWSTQDSNNLMSTDSTYTTHRYFDFYLTKHDTDNLYYRIYANDKELGPNWNDGNDTNVTSNGSNDVIDVSSWTGTKKAYYYQRSALNNADTFYRVKVKFETNGAGYTWVETEEIANLVPTVTLPASAKQDEEVSLSASYTGTAIGSVDYTYWYKLSTDSTYTQAVNGKFTPAASGTYNVYVTAKDNGVTENVNSTENREYDSDVVNLVVAPKVSSYTVTAEAKGADTLDDYSVSLSGAIVTPTSAETGSAITVTANKSVTSGGVTYEFTGWYSAGGTFDDATALSTTFRPTAEGAVAQARYGKLVTITVQPYGSVSVNANLIPSNYNPANYSFTLNGVQNSTQQYQIKAKKVEGISPLSAQVPIGGEIKVVVTTAADKAVAGFYVGTASANGTTIGRMLDNPYTYTATAEQETTYRIAVGSIFAVSVKLNGSGNGQGSVTVSGSTNSTTPNNGTYTYSGITTTTTLYSMERDTIAVTVTPDENSVLSSFTVDGVDVEGATTSGGSTTIYINSSSTRNIAYTFTEKPKTTLYVEKSSTDKYLYLWLYDESTKHEPEGGFGGTDMSSKYSDTVVTINGTDYYKIVYTEDDLYSASQIGVIVSNGDSNGKKFEQTLTTGTIYKINLDDTYTADFDDSKKVITVMDNDPTGRASAATVTPAEAESSGVYIGDDVSVTFHPADGYKVVVDSCNATPTISGNVYSFKMQESGISIQVHYEEIQQYQVVFGTQGANADKGTVTATVDGVAISSGAMVEEEKSVVFTAAATNPLYVFDAWSNSSTDNPLTLTVDGNLEIKASFKEYKGELVNNVYMAYGRGSDFNKDDEKWTAALPVYKKGDVDNVYYAYLDNLEDGNYFFGLSNNSTGYTYTGLWFSDTDRGAYVKEVNTSDGNLISAAEQEWGSYNFARFSRKSEDVISVILKGTDHGLDNDNHPIVTYEIIPVTEVLPEGTVKVYAKDGATTGCTYGETTIAGSSIEGVKDKGNYNYYRAVKGDQLKITTTLHDGLESKYYVYALSINGVRYDVSETSTGVYETVKAYEVLGNEDIEITPVYYSKKIKADGNYITVYVKSNDTIAEKWGNTIALYSYYYNAINGNTTGELDGVYGGQPMVLDPSGYYVGLVSKYYYSNDAQTATEKIIDGVTFNNFYYAETVHQLFLNEDQKKNKQTYDYNDFLPIAEAGWDTVRFDIKNFYHTDSNQKIMMGKTHDGSYTPADGFTLNVNNYSDWEYLTDFDGNYSSIVGKSPVAGYELTEDNLYIVSVGNQHVSWAQWSTMWYVFDNSGNYITKGAPSDFIKRNNDADNTDAYNAIVDGNYDLKKAMITYESESDGQDGYADDSPSVRVDGRWYFTAADVPITIKTGVLYKNANGDYVQDLNASNGGVTYAKATVNGIDPSNKFSTVTVARNSIVHLAASTSTKGYKFVGWKQKVTDENGEVSYQPTSISGMSSDYQLSVDTELYAVYEPVGASEFVISHKKWPGSSGFSAATGDGDYYLKVEILDSNNEEIDTYNTVKDEQTISIDPTSDAQYVRVTLYTVSQYRDRFEYFLYLTDDYDTETWINHFDSASNLNYYDREYAKDSLSNDKTEPFVASRLGDATATFTYSIADYFYNGWEEVYDEDWNYIGIQPVIKNHSLDFYSSLQSDRNIQVNLSFYNREIVNGTPSYISDQATTKTLNLISTNYSTMEALLTDAIARTKIDTITDSYQAWTTNAKAWAATGSEHATDAYGQNKLGYYWTYYCLNDSTVTTECPDDWNTISNVNLMFKSTPKQYTVTEYGVKSVSELVPLNDNYYIGKTYIAKHTGYYNQRVGVELHNSTYDAATDYLRNYFGDGYQGYTGTATKAKDELCDGDYVFAYWSSDPQGTKILSTDYRYRARISGNLNIYPVYRLSNSTVEDTPKAFITADKPDEYYHQNSGKNVTRLNTTFNAVNIETEDIKKVAIVYIRLPEGLDASQLDSSTVKDAVRTTLGYIGDDENKQTENVYIDLSGFDYDYEDYDRPAIEYIYSARYTDLEGNFTGSVLTNLNRVQFSHQFYSDGLATGEYSNLLIVGAMCTETTYSYEYEGEDYTYTEDEWVATENFINYVNGVVKE